MKNGPPLRRSLWLPVLLVEVAYAAVAALVCGCVGLFERWNPPGRDHPPRVLFGPHPVNSWTVLRDALRDQGFPATMMVGTCRSFEVGQVPYDIILPSRFPRLYRSPAGRYLVRLAVFLWAVVSFDVLIMAFRPRLLDGTLLLTWLELPLLSLARRRVVLNTSGSDVSTPYLQGLDRMRHSAHEAYAEDPDHSLAREQATACNRRHCERWAHRIISAIDHLDYLDRVDVVFHMRCLDLAKLPAAAPARGDPPIVVHASNHRHFKGTRYLEEAVAALQERGVPCRAEILEDVPPSVVLDHIRKADVVADQFLIGAYARFAIEAMALEKPVLCYLREDLFALNPIWKDCPIVNADPETLQDRLEELLRLSPQERHEIGRKGRAFVRKYHSKEYVGQRLAGILFELYGD